VRRAKCASSEICSLTGEFVFINAAQTVDVPRENALTYDDCVSGQVVYAYVGGNPLQRTDPRGLQAVWGNIGPNDGAGYAAQQSAYPTYGVDQTSSGWANKDQIVLPIPYTPFGVDVTVTVKEGGAYSIYAGIRATGLSYTNTTEYRCTAGSIKGPTVKVSTAYGWGAGATASTSVSYDGTNLGVQGGVGFAGYVNANAGVWGYSPLSPGIGWTW
jgi:hypothetical protein